MKTFCILACATLFAGCTSATMQEGAFSARQNFGYPQVERVALPALPLPTQPPAPVSAAAAPAVPSVTNPTVPTAPMRAVVSPDPVERPYNEANDPMMRALVERATKPVDEDLHMVDGKIVLPPPARLEIIDVGGVSGALGNAATPSS